jgi:hypothetical protein
MIKADATGTSGDTIQRFENALRRAVSTPRHASARKKAKKAMRTSCVQCA